MTRTGRESVLRIGSLAGVHAAARRVPMRHFYYRSLFLNRAEFSPDSTISCKNGLFQRFKLLLHFFCFFASGHNFGRFGGFRRVAASQLRQTERMPKLRIPRMTAVLAIGWNG